MTDEDLFYSTPPAEARMSNTQVIERARIGNGGGNLIYPTSLEFERENEDIDLTDLIDLVDSSGQAEDDLEMWRR